MAHLDDRGQIILVAAFALGVIFIALAVIVNAAIFTENLATRGSATGGGDALNYRHEVEQNVGHIIEYINDEAGDGASDTDFEKWAKTNITDLSLQGGRQKARIGRVVTITYDSKVMGTQFANRSGSYDDSDNLGSGWTVISDVERTRNFVLNVSSLSASQSNPFTISVSRGLSGPYWNMSIYNQSGTVEVVVNNSVGHVASCERDVSPPFTIDVTGGDVAGAPCRALTVSDGYTMWFASNISDGYDIEFNNSDSISGGYEGIVKGSSISIPSLWVDKKTVIYSLLVRYTYHTPTIHYRTDIRVAPGEPES